ncbi:MAG: hypothetical protein ABIO04_12025 [Ferruginibacter sp.]
MTVETTLRLQFNNDSYLLLIKMIRIESISYFFIRDIENEKTFLDGRVLELTYKDSFALTEFAGAIKSAGIPEEKVLAIQKSILLTEKIWF